MHCRPTVSQVVYVTGRARKPGEINGKSANVNNCLRNVIYGEAADTPDAIPLTEVVVVFDADMAAKRHFFLKVCSCAVEGKLGATWEAAGR